MFCFSFLHFSLGFGNGEMPANIPSQQPRPCNCSVSQCGFEWMWWRKSKCMAQRHWTTHKSKQTNYFSSKMMISFNNLQGEFLLKGIVEANLASAWFKGPSSMSQRERASCICKLRRQILIIIVPTNLS